MNTGREIQSVLWDAAEVLAGVLSASEFVPYLSSLLLIKRLSDQASEPHEPRGFNSHQYAVPPLARWENVESSYGKLAEGLLAATQALEEANPELHGIFRGADFHRIPSGTLRQLVHLFSNLSLRNQDLTAPEILGEAFEWLLLRFHPGSESSTPAAVRRMIVGLARLSTETSIHDPACGTGGMLIAAKEYLTQRRNYPAPLKLSGQEKNVSTWALGKMNLIFHGVAGDIRLGDTLRAPQFIESGKLILFDRILCNPPMGTMTWTAGAPEDDPFGRFSFGPPPKRSPTLAFVQHAYNALRDGGVAVFMVPMGTLFREGTETRIREQMLEKSVIEAVIGLPGNPSPFPSAPSALLILTKQPDHPPRQSVWMMDARETTALELTEVPEMFFPAVAAYEQHGLSAVARLVPWEELKANRFNLNLGLYLPSNQGVEQPDLEMLRDEVFRLESQHQELSRALYEHLEALRPYLPS